MLAKKHGGRRGVSDDSQNGSTLAFDGTDGIMMSTDINRGAVCNRRDRREWEDHR